MGGSYPGALNLAVITDLTQFEPFFQTVSEKATSLLQSPTTKAWLSQICPDMDITLLAHMYAFDNTLRKTYPDMSTNTKNRTQFYHPDTPKTLSQAYQTDVCQCAEIALLAQAYLQQQHVDSRYFSGELLHTAQDEFGEAHSFITLTTERGDYVYDPANPTSYSGVCLPRISSVETTEAQKKLFEQKIHTQNDKRNCAFLAAKDLITKTTWYYGCGDGEDIFPSFIINRPTATPSIPDHSQTYG